MVLKRLTATTSSSNSLQHPSLPQTSNGANSNLEIICDPYKILQVRRDATHSEIRHSYRRLALLYHPGRHAVFGSATNPSTNVSCAIGEKKKEAERTKRLQMFTILAACYEVLMDKESRQQCDALLRQIEYRSSANTHVRNSPEQKSTEQRRLKTLEEVQQHLKQQQREIMPSLTAVSDASSASSTGSGKPAGEETCLCDNSNNREQCHFTLLDCGGQGDVIDDEDDDGDDDVVLPSLIQNSSSSDTTGGIHYTEGETNRLFGGPLRLLYRTRRWQPFTDPFTVFAKVFGSKIHLGDVTIVESAAALATTNCSLDDWKVTPLPPTLNGNNGNSKNAAWTGTSQKLPNGTVIYTTSRIVRNRRFTRTETMRVDAHGKKHSYITVTSEELDPCEGMINKEDDSDMGQCCIRLELCLHYVTSGCQPKVENNAMTTPTATTLPEDRDDKNNQNRSSDSTTAATDWFACWLPSCV